MSLFYTNREVRIIKEISDEAVKEQEQMYSCEMCTDEYDSETELHVHRKAKHREEVAKILLENTSCKICVTKHKDMEELLKHTKSVHLLSSEDAEHVHREIFICDDCNLMYFNKKMLEIHIMYIHDPRKRSKRVGICPKCNKKIQLNNVWFHFQRHLIQSVVCCQICLRKCINQADLQNHLKTHLNYYHCTMCGYESKLKDNFTAHMQAHNSNLHESGNIAIDADMLLRCFVPKQNAKKSTSIGSRGLCLYELFVCILCRGLVTEEEKAAHIAKYHLVDIVSTKKQYTCTCGEQFFNNVLLKHHVFKLKGEHKACNS
ncbi:zinc finger Y-chromosomal protein 1-like [Leguminivora glycinivorella]|uniref:zinc finger Y-chromosomal protein 1-like n=1 Tax=Leguminivora glycinivorella TaxID=1035111 RepID=UPI00200EC76A|nr:zinc finger Y-chromosomal protein 1-like [Leguminivora glycinivorella]